MVSDGEGMMVEIDRLLSNESARRQLAASGRETILTRHTCAHRVEELMQIDAELHRKLKQKVVVS